MQFWIFFFGSLWKPITCDTSNPYLWCPRKGMDYDRFDCTCVTVKGDNWPHWGTALVSYNSIIPSSLLTVLTIVLVYMEESWEGELPSLFVDSLPSLYEVETTLQETSYKERLPVYFGPFYSGLVPTQLKISWCWRGTPSLSSSTFFLPLQRCAIRLSFLSCQISLEVLLWVTRHITVITLWPIGRPQGCKHFCYLVNACTCISCYQSCLVAYPAAPISHCFWEAKIYLIKYTFGPIWDMSALRHDVIGYKWGNWNLLACPTRNNRGSCHILELYFPILTFAIQVGFAAFKV